MTPTAKKKKTRLIRVLELVCAVILILGIWSLLRYGGYGTETHYVDVNSGRFRCVKTIYEYTVSDVVEETDFSRHWKHYFGPYPEPRWEIQREYPWFGRHVSPHYGFLGVPNWENWIADACESPHFSDEMKKIILQRFLERLQKYEPLLAGPYARGMLDLLDDEGSKPIITPTNAPKWLLEGLEPPRK